MRNLILSILKEQVKPAIGCTEPIAVALAVAKAKRYVTGSLKKINIVVSPSIYKNGFSVTIPGTSKTGNAYAAALSFAGGNAEYGLEVLKDCDDSAYQKADNLLSLVTVAFDPTITGVFVCATIVTEEGEASVEIHDRHDNIVLVKKDDEIVFQSKPQTSANTHKTDISKLCLSDFRKGIEEMDSNDLSFMMEGVRLNMAMAERGLADGPGMAVGQSIRDLIDQGLMEDCVISQARMYAAAAADARMGGINQAVMSSAGSGNHGITAIVPIVIVAKAYNIPEDKMVKAIAFSHLTTYYVKNYTGRLSPICGCAIAAGVGAAAGITWMLGGDDSAIEDAINALIGNMSGILCDGAKHDCALKISTSASEAVMFSLLATTGHTLIRERNGIVLPDADQSIRNLGSVCVHGMAAMDNEILKVIM